MMKQELSKRALEYYSGFLEELGKMQSAIASGQSLEEVRTHAIVTGMALNAFSCECVSDDERVRRLTAEYHLRKWVDEWAPSAEYISELKRFVGERTVVLSNSAVKIGDTTTEGTTE